MAEPQDIMTFDQRLCRSLGAADRRMGEFREKRAKFLREVVGVHYPGIGSASSQPVPYLWLAKAVLVPSLMNGEFAVEATTEDLVLSGYAPLFSKMATKTLEDLHFQETLECVVDEALMSLGVVATGDDAETDEAGTPWDDRRPNDLSHSGGLYSEPVQIGDWIEDLDCGRREGSRFQGHRWRASKEYAYDSGDFDKKVLDKMRPWNTADRARVPGQEALAPQGPTDQGCALYDEFEFIDAWLPRERVIVTVPGDFGIQQRVAETDWRGPEGGPYDVLTFNDVPGEILPIPLMAVLYDLNMMLNKVARKIGRGADKEKSVVLYDRAAASDDAKHIAESSDQGTVGVDSVDKIKEISFGGASDLAYKYTGWARSLLGSLAGNIDLIGGLGAMSGTASQDLMLSQNAGIRMDHMRTKIRRLVARIARKVLWFRLSTSGKRARMSVDLGGVTVPVEFNPRDFLGQYLLWNFDIDPYAMVPDSPIEQAQRIMATIAQVGLPLAQAGAAQGMNLDVEALMRILARKQRMPELSQIFVRGAATEIGVPGSAPNLEPQPQNPSPGREIRKAVRPNQIEQLEGAMA